MGIINRLYLWLQRKGFTDIHKTKRYDVYNQYEVDCINYFWVRVLVYDISIINDIYCELDMIPQIDLRVLEEPHGYVLMYGINILKY